ncbi:ATP-dependent DNA helicase 2 subunit 1 [Pseudohyphozyma bogoriensis]|nr:ATP-dependent DNA helicase 2 subunit 1 [Pseudohyphozyma bogoriensis]
MASQFEGWSKPFGSDDEDEVFDEFRTSRSSLLFLLEATPSMLAPLLPTKGVEPAEFKGWTSPPKSKMEAALRAVYAVCKKKIISSPKDSIGVLVWNTTETKGSGDTSTKHCFLLQDLAQPTAQSIKTLKTLLADAEEDPSYLASLLTPSKRQNVVAEALGFCNTIFRARAPKIAKKKIYLVTDNDDPVDGNDQLTNVAVHKRQDLLDMDYELEPFLIPPSEDATFDMTKFYGRVLSLNEMEGGPGVPPQLEHSLAESLKNMVDNMRSKESAKRTAFSIPFTLGEGLVIGVQGYALVGEEKKRPPVKVDLETKTGEVVVSKTVYKDSNSGEPLDLKKDVKKYIQVGHPDVQSGVEATKIFFDDAEVKKLKTLGMKPGLTLLGFKPRDEFLKFEQSVKHSYFIYPNEDTYSGSTRTFTALLDSMDRKDVIGFGVFLARAASKPQIVVLIPQVETLTDSGLTADPPGIHICQLPFADDVRALNIDSMDSVYERDDGVDLVNAAKDMIKKLRKKYVPAEHPNPALNFFYDTLAAFALNEELPDPVDETIPKYHVIEKFAGPLITAFKSKIQLDEVDSSRLEVSKQKRPADPKPKVVGSKEDIDTFVALFRKQGPKLKNAELQAGLKLLGEKTGGKKQELVGRINAALRARGDDGGEADESEEEKPKKRLKRSKKKVIESEEEEDAESEEVPEPDTASEGDDEEDEDFKKVKKERKGSKDKKGRRKRADSMDVDDDE